MIKSLFIFFALIFVVFFNYGCSISEKGKESQGKKQSGRNEEIKKPTYILYNVVHKHYRDGKLVVKIEFEKGYYYANDDTLMVDKCSFEYYEDSKLISKGRSDRAKFFISRSFLIAMGNIIVTSEENQTNLFTDYLEWHGDTNTFTTDSFVEITRKNGDSISGRGLKADISLKRVKILHNVRGKIVG